MVDGSLWHGNIRSSVPTSGWLLVLTVHNIDDENGEENDGGDCHGGGSDTVLIEIDMGTEAVEGFENTEYNGRKCSCFLYRHGERNGARLESTAVWEKRGGCLPRCGG